MNRRQLLKGIGAAGAAAAFRGDGWIPALQAQAPVDWAARIGALPRPGTEEIVVSAVGDMIISSPAAGRQAADVQQMYRILRESDVSFGNCEQPVASVGFMYQKTSQMAWPEILDDLKASGFTMLAAANNHYMDLGPEALVQGLDESRKRGFTIAGAGRNLDEASAAGVTAVKGVRVGLLSFWCNQLQPGGYLDYARAGVNKVGVAVISGAQVTIPGSDGSTSTLLLPVAADMAMLEQAVKRARAQVDLLLVSFHFHWGGVGLGQGPRQSDPNSRRILPADLNDPRNRVAEGRRLIAKAAIDAGADVIMGHGPHVLNGVEMYRGKPILYSLGHFYMEITKDGKALPEFRFNPGMVRSVENNWYLEEHRWAAVARMFVRGGRVTRLQILPVYMDVQKDGFPFLPADADSRKINAAMTELSKAFGTELRTAGWYSEVALAT
ncbi:MAG: CapA family protein [Acidobacteria bacterium]|nr:CapA family protein [Acidobacteriota bacterium]